jgi:hypothetical protein
MTLSIPFTQLDSPRSSRSPSSKSIGAVLAVIRQPNPLLFAGADAFARSRPGADGRPQTLETYATYALEGRGVYYSKSGLVLTDPTIDISDLELHYARLLAMAHTWASASSGLLHPWFIDTLEELGWDRNSDSIGRDFDKIVEYATYELIDGLGYSPDAEAGAPTDVRTSRTPRPSLA